MLIASKSHASGGAAAAVAPARERKLDVRALRAAITPSQLSIEETKLRKIEESIRVFVRVADPKFRQVVPMRFFNLTLTPAEAAAYCADYLEEKSLRAGTARVLLRIVAVIARIATELEELNRHENVGSLWKLHADSLIVLLEVADTLAANAARVLALATQHQAAAEAEAIRQSLGKLRERTEAAGRTLAQAS